MNVRGFGIVFATMTLLCLLARPVPASGGATAGSELWSARHDCRGGGLDEAKAVAVSPDGTRVYVAGIGCGARFTTIAYSAATGRQLWLRQYQGPGTGQNAAADLAVAPDGETVFVTGAITGRGGDYGTIAYRAATGRRLWVAAHDGSAHGDDDAYAVAVSPNGTRVFVTGTSRDRISGPDVSTVAYGAATGSELWARQLTGPGKRYDIGRDVTTTPNGRIVIVAGVSIRPATRANFATVAYRAASGAPVWTELYRGVVEDSDDVADEVAVSPNGHRVYVTGISGERASEAAATIAYRPATGQELWARRSAATTSESPYLAAVSMAVAPTGTSLFISVPGPQATETPLLQHLHAGNGSPAWTVPGGGGDIVASPDGSTVFAITGGNLVTAYGASKGSPRWSSGYGDGQVGDDPLALATSPDGSTVFATGALGGSGANPAIGTIAYRTG